MRVSVLLLASTLFACSPAMAAPLALDLPSGWTDTAGPTGRVIASGDKDIAVTLVEGISAADGKAAAVAAWTKVTGETRAVDQLFDLVAERGWDQAASARMESPPADKMARNVGLRRFGNTWTAIVVNAPEAALIRNGGQFGAFMEALAAPGYTKESFAGRTARRLGPAEIAKMKDFVSLAMKEYKIPGAGLAFIQDGKIIWEGGLGVRQLGRPEKVDAHTRFMIASNTKGMTTLMIASLVGEGKIRWDQKVKDLYPEFRLGDSKTTDQVLVRHLVCACTGLPRKDLEFIFNSPPGKASKTVFDDLAMTQPTSAFGAKYQYSNTLAAAAGYVAAHALYPKMEVGAAYDRAMQERVFGPLGMRDTTFSMERGLKGNHASPHGLGIGEDPEIVNQDFNRSIDVYRPAGGAWSSAHDLALYAASELTAGKLGNGRQFVDRNALLERRKPGVVDGKDSFYGMGLTLDRSEGVDVVHHGGHLLGYFSDFVVVPGANAAAVLLLNEEDARPVLASFRRRFLEVLYDGRPEAEKFVVDDVRGLRKDQLTFIGKVNANPPAAITASLGTSYSNTSLGTLRVRRAGDQLWFDFTSWSSRMASRPNPDGTTSMVTISPGIAGMSFLVGKDDRGRPTLTADDGQHQYVYVAD